MLLRRKLLELCDPEGPNIPQRTLAVYCGVEQSQLNRFMKTGSGISEERQQQIARGLKEMALEIWQIVSKEE